MSMLFGWKVQVTLLNYFTPRKGGFDFREKIVCRGVFDSGIYVATLDGPNTKLTNIFTLQEAALKLGVLTHVEFDTLVVPEKMLGPSD
jgi:hypothetical protein